ncbi:hypothetical protein T08_4869 [Trichinella sp. T8]|nr:hypothetical protein T08_4869 [Trichinella sp. T8]
MQVLWVVLVATCGSKMMLPLLSNVNMDWLCHIAGFNP